MNALYHHDFSTRQPGKTPGMGPFAPPAHLDAPPSPPSDGIANIRPIVNPLFPRRYDSPQTVSEEPQAQGDTMAAPAPAPVAGSNEDTKMEGISPKDQTSMEESITRSLGQMNNRIASFESRADPDAQTTVTDFLDFTEYLPSDMVRSLTLIGNLDQRYVNASHKVDELTTVWSRLPTLPADERPSPVQLRADISEQLDQAALQQGKGLAREAAEDDGELSDRGSQEPGRDEITPDGQDQAAHQDWGRGSEAPSSSSS
ncbi:hypothetical protein NM208_g14000 [Fusarium decemcellulare]|uniref:Uncharacterized protein n=1 Tax=Fusarium decemcellulare TaxID=57161 RepID=A0ACC1RHN0_9HYPO|nr:hypothetical protein NM208_g14000 [Fusarium decemcellulare]